MDVIYMCLGLFLMAQYSDAACPSLFSEFNSGCYFVGNNRVPNVEQAYFSCKSLGGYLLNINAEPEYKHVIEMIQAQPTQFDGYWTGGKIVNKFWVWEKVNKRGEYVTTYMDPSATHYHWGPREPRSSFPVVENFAALMVRSRPRPYHLYSENAYLNTLRGLSYVCEANWSE